MNEHSLPVEKKENSLTDGDSRAIKRWWRQIEQGDVRLPGPARWVVSGIVRTLDWPKKRLQPYFDWLLRRQDIKFVDAGLDDFMASADNAMLMQEPVKARVLIKLMIWLAVLFLVWATFTKVNEVTRGDGKVIPFSQVQMIQNLDGGIVSQIFVHEGDVVDKDQILMRIDDTRSLATLKESKSQVLALEAKAARLRALAENTKLAMPQEVIQEDPATAEEEKRLYESRKSELETTISIAKGQLSQRQHELSELQAKEVQADKAWELTYKELTLTKPLRAAGAVSDVDILKLERDVARFKGDRDMAAAQIQRVKAAITESTGKVKEVEDSFRNDARKDLSETMAKLNGLNEATVGLSDKVSHSVMRSPVRGTVKRLLVNTVGGVIRPGENVMEIVPLDDKLLLEVRVQPRDIGFLRPGLRTMIRFSAYDFSIYGGLAGTLESIGADTVVDEKGNAFYLVRVKTDKSSLGPNLPIIPGMVAEVDIQTGEKSILSYMLKPVLRAHERALTER
ncbi:MAG: HlyD family type I secretion periplasmic adaptor subunit [Betaproteobacteria bacterium]|nr:HlyD family type I secretion periplasmic adaptor subunit [Betaproteobacteria bacterium]